MCHLEASYPYILNTSGGQDAVRKRQNEGCLPRIDKAGIRHKLSENKCYRNTNYKVLNQAILTTEITMYKYTKIVKKVINGCKSEGY